MGEATHSVDVNTDVRTAYNQWTEFEEFPMFMDGQYPGEWGDCGELNECEIPPEST